MGEIRERSFGSVKLRIHRDTCIGTAACRNVAPEVFDLDSSQIVDFVPDAPQDVDRDRLAEACQVCPVDALELVEP